MKMKKYKRTEVYKQKQEPKYMFQWICDHIYSSVPEPRNMLDIGAASGDFLDYASARFLNCEFIGIERDPELVEIGNQNSRFQLTNGDAENLQFDDQFFDVVIMTGTHSIFDVFQPSFTEALRVTKTGGLIMITGIFNDYPIDTQIAWRYPNADPFDWNPGYNYWSKETISNFLHANGTSNMHEFVPFELPFDLKKTEMDPIRSWTENTETGKRILVNGIMPLNIHGLKIHKA